MDNNTHINDIDNITDASNILVNTLNTLNNLENSYDLQQQLPTQLPRQFIFDSTMRTYSNDLSNNTPDDTPDDTLPSTQNIINSLENTILETTNATTSIERLINIMNIGRRTNIPIGNINSLQSILNSTLNDKTPYKNILSEEGEKTLKTLPYTNNPDLFPNDKCPIMYTPFEENQDVIQLPCKHCFNSDSIIKWLKEEKAECPVCRFKLDSDEKKITQTQTNQSQSPSLTTSRTTLFNSLSRLPIHPFGPRNSITSIRPQYSQITNFINEQDEQDDESDLQRALYESMRTTTTPPPTPTTPTTTPPPPPIPLTSLPPSPSPSPPPE